MVAADWACRNGYVESLGLMLGFKATPAAVVNGNEDDSQTLLHIATSNGHAACIRVIIQHGQARQFPVDVNAADLLGKTHCTSLGIMDTKIVCSSCSRLPE